MNRCLFPILSRTGARLPAALFIGNKLHSVLPLERKVDGYEALFPAELQEYLDSDIAQVQGIAVSDLDTPRARPQLYSQERGWSVLPSDQSTAESITHDLAVSALRPVDLWPVESLSTRLVTLVAMGCDVDAVSHALFIDLLARIADIDGLKWISHQLRRRPAQVSDALMKIAESAEFHGLNHSLIEPCGAATEMLLTIARHCQTPPYKRGRRQAAMPSLADYSPGVALTGGWWKPVGSGTLKDHWSGYSAAVVIRPPAAGRWTFQAIRSERDAGIAIARWRTIGEPGLESQLREADGAVLLHFDSPNGAALVLEFETERFFIPSSMVPTSRDHRSLALCFRDFNVEPLG